MLELEDCGVKGASKGAMETRLSISPEWAKLQFNKLVLGLGCAGQDFRCLNSTQTPMIVPKVDVMEMERSGGDISSANGASQQS